MKKITKIEGREKRHAIIRKRVSGTKERPRLSLYKSNKNLFAQVIDDTVGVTLIASATNSPELKSVMTKAAGNIKGATVLGKIIAEKCLKVGIDKIVFDRSGYLYHGRVKALAEAARKGGLKF